MNTPAMHQRAFNRFCRALPATTHVVQWGGSDVWKVGGKVFAVGVWDDDHGGISVKVSPIAFEVLKDQPGLRPAPYLASRGLSWIQHYAPPGLRRAELEDLIRQSHRLAGLGLPKKTQAALGLDLD